MEDFKAIFYHLLAAITVTIWGVTFVSTKVLINNGLSSVEIFFYRFLLAYCCMLLFSHSKKWTGNYKDEFLLFLCGLTGGSLYFIAENTALGITLASNVSLLICTAPIFTILLSYMADKVCVKKSTLGGSFLALSGVFLVVFNGNFIFKITPLGDVLTIVAAIMWAVYCLLFKKMSLKYETLFITRKVFFYGILSLFPYFLFHPLKMNTELLFRPVVYLNLLFLGLIASMLCYIMWNCSVKKLGPAPTANYIYIVPLITIVTSIIILNESLTIISLAGAICIIGGVYIAERR